MNTSTPARGPYARSCGTCHKRKVKCDRATPCSNCVKTQSECVYSAPGTRVRRAKKVKDSASRENELRGKLAKLEGVVAELRSGLVDPETMKDADKIPPSRDGEVDNEIGKLVISGGSSHYLGSEFWARLTTELEDVREELDESISDEDESSPVTNTNTPSTLPAADSPAFMYGYSSSDVDLSTLHPLPSQIMFYWEMYLEKVETLLKIFHVPSMTEIVKKCKDDLGTLNKSSEAAMFAIYLATVSSMPSDEVERNFGTDRSTLMRRYRFGTQQALSRAYFLKTSEIMTVQALVLLLLLYDKDDDSRTHWCFIGSALRIAQAMGLHRDGTLLGLSPFDTEIRRRLWWLLCATEIRAAGLFGADPSIGVYAFDTKLPSNVNDTDLDPLSISPVQPRIGMTDMSNILVRLELTQTQLRLADSSLNRGKEMTLAEKERLVTELGDHLEANYFAHYDQTNPVLQISAKSMRSTIVTLSLSIYDVHSGGQTRIVDSLPQDARDRLFQLCIDDIETTNEILTSPLTRKYSWAAQTHVQWPVMAYLLREISRRPPSEFVERGWRAVVSVFKAWGDRTRSTENSTLWTPMRKLMANAKRKRQADAMALSQAQEGGPSASMPSMVEHSTSVPIFEPGNFGAPPAATNPWDTQPLSEIPTAQPSAYDFPVLPDQAGLQFHGNMDMMAQDPSLLWLDDAALMDLQMGVMDNNISWEGWDDVARDFQINSDQATQPYQP